MPEERGISPAVIIPVGLGLGLVAAVGVAALAWAAPPTPPPGRANLYGKVTDADTGQPVAGALVLLDSMQTYTDSSGNYLFADLELGEYMLGFSKEGYPGGEIMVNLVEGENVLNVEMARAMASLSGTVTDADTGAPLSGVNVMLGTTAGGYITSTYTDSSGNYSLTNIVPGEYRVRFEKDGYQAVEY